MFDIVTAVFGSRVIYAVMCVMGVLLAIAYWRRRRFPLYFSMVLLGGLFLVFQPWRYVGAFEEPSELPVWDDGTMEILSIYRTVFIVFTGFLAMFLFFAVVTIRRIRHCERL